MPTRPRGAPVGHFLNLCDDNLLLVARHLSFHERYEYLKAHRRVWRLLSANLPRSINMCNTPPQVVVPVLKWITTTCRSVRYLNIHGCTAEGLAAVLPPMLEACKGIEVLNVQHCAGVDDTVIDAVATHLAGSLRQISLWDTGNATNDRLSKATLLRLMQRCTRLEVVDLRGQKRVDDDVLAEMGRSLTGLRKVALSGTAVTGHGFTSLIAARRNSIQRMGCFCLRPRPDGQAPVEINAADMEELQVGMPYVMLRCDVRAMPNLKFLGVGQVRDLESVVDWYAAASSNITQITADFYNYYPDSFLACLEALAPQLRHLSVISNLSQPQFATILPACTKLRQLAVHAPTCEQLLDIAELPALEYLKVVDIAVEDLENFIQGCMSDVHDGQLDLDVVADFFPRLTNLSISFRDEDTPEEADATSPLATLVSIMPRLEGLFIYEAVCSFERVLSKANALQMKYLSLTGDGQGGNAATPRGALDVIKTMRNLIRLHICAIPPQDELDALVMCLPDLVVLGPNGKAMLTDASFCSWTVARTPDGGKRYLRQRDPYGYNEADALKPYEQFVGFLEECEDPFYPTMEP